MSGKPGPSIPAEGHPDRPQDGDQPIGFAGGRRDEVW
jgi:hypothetical protein